ncbi:transcriptional regulator, HxlR family [Chitinophaga sp. YR627]|uniref:Transcriptional regulator, HxlR family n=1 Tax=Chitinophaga pinensis (strain ATCC 43595 / DSM 2588 / LMG 13176 / NBRC 15968 / NCIMB 11800 / UQM 2034) TaxID=485918 RepID=A0A979G6V5_CHIPD|nr:MULTISPECIES: helix-turn-helix domain-containing protein [Chitinophaga]ACU61697.1 transcriptional regulator, HxlR family [Chitinophaga pinensis DSM 2588]SFO75361.1 transcriptional regulator, HxlR family [Chitinophaga sp. YR627]
MENKLDHADCPITETIAMFGGRWKVTILRVLFKNTRRFGEIQVRIPSISKKVLTEQLRELEADGLISRKQYKELPPRVEYALTDFGKSLCPLLIDIVAWKRKNIG